MTFLTLSFLPLQEVRSTSTAFLLRRIPALKIKVASKKEVFEANLKTECDLWHLMVKEMWAGKKLADDHKVGDAGPLCPLLWLPRGPSPPVGPVAVLSCECSGSGLGLLSRVSLSGTILTEALKMLWSVWPSERPPGTREGHDEKTQGGLDRCGCSTARFGLAMSQRVGLGVAGAGAVHTHRPELGVLGSPALSDSSRPQDLEFGRDSAAFLPQG